MIVLDTTTKSLEVVLAANVTSAQLTYVSCWADINSTFAASALSEGDGNTANQTAVTIVPAPGANVSRLLKFLTIQNTDTAPALLTLRANNNATIRNIWAVTLQVNDTLSYRDGQGFEVMDANGRIKRGDPAMTSTGSFVKLDSIAASFNGAQTVFNLTQAGAPVSPGTAQNLLVSIDGVIQEPGVAFTLNGTQLTLAAAPVTNATFFGVVFGGNINGVVNSAGLTVTGNSALGNTVINGSLVVNSSLTITSTGNINDLDFANAAMLVCNNASLLTITGLKAGQPGQMLTIVSSGLGEVDLAWASANSAAANRLLNFISSGIMPLAPDIAAGTGGRAVYQYDGVLSRWRMVSFFQGPPINYAPTWTGSGTLTFTPVSQTTMSYLVRDKRIAITMNNYNGTVAGAGNLILFTLPNGYTPSQGSLESMLFNNPSSVTNVGLVSGSAANNKIILEQFAAPNFSTGSYTFFWDAEFGLN